MNSNEKFNTIAVLNTFNSRAGAWNTKRAHISDKQGESRRLFRLLDTLDLRNNTILDLGCGTGKVSKHITALCPSANVIAMDISQAMLENFSCQFFNGFRLLSEASNIGLCTSLCDICVCQQVLHHTSHPRRVLKEISRVVKCGGFLLLLTVGPEYHDSIFPYKADTTMQQDPLGRANKLEITRLVSEEGFWVQEVIDDMFSFTFNSFENYFNFLLSIGSIHKIHRYQEPPMGYCETLRRQVMATHGLQCQTDPLVVKGHYITVLARRKRLT